jgi:hypothetical protein
MNLCERGMSYGSTSDEKAGLPMESPGRNDATGRINCAPGTALAAAGSAGV